MGRLDNVCLEKHTPLSPSKNRIRRDWLKTIPRKKDIITISHGIFDTLMTMEWKGRVQACDIDPGVRQAIDYMRKSSGNQKSDYFDLKILPSGESIQVTVADYCKRYGVKDLGAVDVDLAVGIIPCWNILYPVLSELLANKYRGKVFLTFRNGRDGFGKRSTSNRLLFLMKRLPKGVKYVRATQYRSGRYNQNAQKSVGSPMCFVELKFA